MIFLERYFIITSMIVCCYNNESQIWRYETYIYIDNCKEKMYPKSHDFKIHYYAEKLSSNFFSKIFSLFFLKKLLQND